MNRYRLEADTTGGTGFQPVAVLNLTTLCYDRRHRGVRCS